MEYSFVEILVISLGLGVLVVKQDKKLSLDFR